MPCNKEPLQRIESIMTRAPVAKRSDKTCALIFSRPGLGSQIARACGIRQQAVSGWKRVPSRWVCVVAEMLKSTPEEVRPDIFKPR